MRVTFVTPVYAPSVGGAQELVRRVAEGLAGRGHDVEVLTTDRRFDPRGLRADRIEPRTERLGGVAVRRFGVSRRFHLLARNLWRANRRLRPRSRSARAEGYGIAPVLIGPAAPRGGLAVRRALRERDVVIGTSAPTLASLAPSRLRPDGAPAAVAAMPLLHVRTGEEVHRQVVAALGAADGCVAMTEDEADALVGLGVDRAHVLVQPPGTDLGRFAGRSAPEARARLGLPEGPTVAFVGRLAPHKGLDVLRRASARIWAEVPDAVVLVAGEAGGWDGWPAEAAAWDAEATGRLVRRPGFAEEEKADLLEAADVVVSPSREESFGFSAVDAWAARRPIVAADVPAVRRVIRPDVDGRLVPVDDHEALAAAVVALLADPAAAATLGSAGRARVEAEFRWDVVVDRWDRFLTGLVAARRGGT